MVLSATTKKIMTNKKYISTLAQYVKMEKKCLQNLHIKIITNYVIYDYKSKLQNSKIKRFYDSDDQISIQIVSNKL